MRAYELIYILNPATDEETTNAVVEKFKGIIENNGGQIDKLDKWGKKKMAYLIEDCAEGYYVMCNFKAEADLPQELDRVLKITDEVIKHLIVRVED